RNWRREIPDLLLELDDEGIDVELFFQLERTVTFKLTTLLSDANELHKVIVDPNVDVSPFIARLGHAFLPGAVYQLEEYGLPRMISRKIHRSGAMNFNDPSLDLPTAIKAFQSIGLETISKIPSLSRFDVYVLKFFYEGITQDPIKS
ncbi:hypothetical protein ASB66_020980, partial [Agrobacterium vitis]